MRFQHSLSGPALPLRAAALPVAVLLALLLPLTVRASGSAGVVPVSTAQPGGGPSLAFARYIGTLQKNNPRAEPGTVAVDIEASLPELGKQGRLIGIRHQTPSEKANFQILHIEGDSMVKRQVIARYLSAEAQADALSASSVAVTPRNYKFRYVGSIGAGGTLVYVFQITPRKKRDGLLQGQLWIDSASGLAVHQGGHLVKKPSLFVRRIEILRDTRYREGLPYIRVTHLEIDTRLVGRARLTITERAAPQSPDEAIAPMIALGPGAPIACALISSEGGKP